MSINWWLASKNVVHLHNEKKVEIVESPGKWMDLEQSCWMK